MKSVSGRVPGASVVKALDSAPPGRETTGPGRADAGRGALHVLGQQSGQQNPEERLDSEEWPKRRNSAPSHKGLGVVYSGRAACPTPSPEYCLSKIHSGPALPCAPGEASRQPQIF